MARPSAGRVACSTVGICYPAAGVSPLLLEWLVLELGLITHVGHVSFVYITVNSAVLSHVHGDLRIADYFTM